MTAKEKAQELIENYFKSVFKGCSKPRKCGNIMLCTGFLFHNCKL